MLRTLHWAGQATGPATIVALTMSRLVGATPLEVLSGGLIVATMAAELTRRWLARAS